MSATPAAASSAPATAAAKHPHFTKIDASGNALADDAGKWFAVRVIDGSMRFDVLAGDLTEEEVTHAEALAAAEACTAGGFTDWRLASDRELSYLTDRSRFHRAIDPRFFPDVKPSWYWTSSPGGSGPVCAWIVSFGGGGVSLGLRDGNAFVRAVRSVPASQ